MTDKYFDNDKSNLEKVPALANWGKAVVICTESGDRFESNTAKIGVLSDYEGDYPEPKDIYVTDDYIWTVEIDNKRDYLVWEKINENQDKVSELLTEAAEYMSSDELDEICMPFHGLRLSEMQQGLIAALTVILKHIRKD